MICATRQLARIRSRYGTKAGVVASSNVLKILYAPRARLSRNQSRWQMSGSSRRLLQALWSSVAGRETGGTTIGRGRNAGGAQVRRRACATACTKPSPRRVPLSRVWIPALPFIPLFKEAAAEMVCEYAAVEASVLLRLIKITGSGTPRRTRAVTHT